MNEQTSFPLSWPTGRPRITSRDSARFDTSFAQARDGLAAELDRLGARSQILSSNVPLRLDGQPYANAPEPKDPGVAVYFKYKGRQFAFACDRWNRVKDNIQAIRKTIEALRGIARWGTGDMMEAAFNGYMALEEKTGPSCWEILGLNQSGISVMAYAHAEDAILKAYREKAKKAHPDAGGSSDEFAQLTQAKDIALQTICSR
jgi:hypothetical protein